MISNFAVKSATKIYNVNIKNDLSFISEIIDIENSFFVLDKKVFNLYSEYFDKIPKERLVLIDALETNKTIDTALYICEQMLSMTSKRNTHLVSFGGGIIQDITGFVANVLYRGVKWIFVPTTLLASCDSCIGGKTSLNYKTYKNLLGTFFPPDSIDICPSFFKTLSKTDLFSGLGEVVKFNVMAGKDTLSNLEQNIDLLLSQDTETINRFIISSLLFKKNFIEIDEFDRAERIQLNFAHTFGHAIEVVSNYGIPHGTAVAIGVVVANSISVKRNIMSRELAKRIEKLIKKILILDIDKNIFDMDIILSAIYKDKKQTNKQITAVLMNEDFKLSIVNDITVDEIKYSFYYIKEFI